MKYFLLVFSFFIASCTENNNDSDMHLKDYPNDKLIQMQWGHTSSEINWIDAYKTVRKYYPVDYTTDNTAPIAAVIDTGFEKHKDMNNLFENITYIADCNVPDVKCSVEPNYTNSCYSTHGIGVIGILAADTDNNEGIAGTGFGIIKILAIDAHAYLNGTHQQGMKGTNIIAAVDYIVKKKNSGANIIAVNMSFRSDSQQLKSSVEKLKNNGIIVVASAGFNDQNYPASFNFDNIISVATLGKNLQHGNYTGKADIAAPTDILSFSSNNKYANSGGPSASAPYITGIITAGVAVYNSKKTIAVYRDISYQEIISTLYSTANRDSSGFKYINAGRFMNEIEMLRDNIIAGNVL